MAVQLPLEQHARSTQSAPLLHSSTSQAPRERPSRLRFKPIYVRLEGMNTLATGFACPQTHCSANLGRGLVVSGNRAGALGLLSLLLAIGCRA